MAITWKSIGNGIGNAAKNVARPGVILGLGAVNPALGVAAGRALGITGTVKKAIGLTKGYVKPAPPRVPVVPATVPMTTDLPSYGMDAPVLLPAQGSIPMGRAPTPDLVPAMPYATFRSIMQQAYDKGTRHEFD